MAKVIIEGASKIYRDAKNREVRAVDHVTLEIQDRNLWCWLGLPVAVNPPPCEWWRVWRKPMGSEVYLYMNTGAHNFIARVGTAQKADVEQQINLFFKMKNGHFFDVSTEQAIT